MELLPTRDHNCVLTPCAKERVAMRLRKFPSLMAWVVAATIGCPASAMPIIIDVSSTGYPGIRAAVSTLDGSKMVAYNEIANGSTTPAYYYRNFVSNLVDTAGTRTGIDLNMLDVANSPTLGSKMSSATDFGGSPAASLFSAAMMQSFLAVYNSTKNIDYALTGPRRKRHLQLRRPLQSGPGRRHHGHHPRRSDHHRWQHRRYRQYRLAQLHGHRSRRHRQDCPLRVQLARSLLLVRADQRLPVREVRRTTADGHAHGDPVAWWTGRPGTAVPLLLTVDVLGATRWAQHPWTNAPAAG